MTFGQARAAMLKRSKRVLRTRSPSSIPPSRPQYQSLPRTLIVGGTAIVASRWQCCWPTSFTPSAQFANARWVHAGRSASLSSPAPGPDAPGRPPHNQDPRRRSRWLFPRPRRYPVAMAVGPDAPETPSDCASPALAKALRELVY